MSFTPHDEGPDPHDVQGCLRSLEHSVRESLKDEVSTLDLSVKQGDLRVDITMDPNSGRVRVGIRQYFHEDRDNPGGETRKGFVVDLNMGQLPDLKPGSELTRLIPENTELAQKLYGEDLWTNRNQQS